jgi:hypothetical protein
MIEPGVFRNLAPVLLVPEGHSRSPDAGTARAR